MNNRGQFLIAGALIIAAIILTLILLFPKVRFILIGVALFVVLITILVKGNMTKTKGIIAGVLLIASVFFMFGSGILQSTLPTSTFTPIFCNDYEFTCCNEIVSYTQSFKLSHTDAWICPLTATKCVITPDKTGLLDTLYYGRGNCKYSGFLIPSWNCDTSTSVRASSFTIYPGDYVWGLLGDTTRQTIVSINVYQGKLSFCGRAGCTTGIAVSGADQCKFNPPNGIIYTSTNALTGKVSTPSYTVPLGDCVLAWQSGDRHICGYKEESCSSNSDCQGIVCTGRTKQTYGCVNYGTIFTGGDRGPFDSGWGVDVLKPTSGNANYGKRCEITNAIQVQCCGDTDCGTNFFCDKTSNTCKEKVECVQNSDCGVSTTCDYTTKKLKTPICNALGKCAFREESVGCCLDVNCPTDYFCNANKECEKNIPGKVACPFQCCINEDKYFDRPCSNNEFCINNNCVIEGCKSDADCTGGQICSYGDCIDKPIVLCKWYQDTIPAGEQCGFLGWRKLPFTGGCKEYEASCRTPATWIYIAGAGLLLTIIVISTIAIKIKSKKGKRK